MSGPIRRRALGDQAIHLIRESTEVARDIERESRRTRVDAASVRPTPGTSDLLGRPLHFMVAPGVGLDGKLRMVEVHDLLAMAPIHLVGMDRPGRKSRR